MTPFDVGTMTDRNLNPVRLVAAIAAATMNIVFLMIFTLPDQSVPLVRSVFNLSIPFAPRDQTTAEGRLSPPPASESVLTSEINEIPVEKLELLANSNAITVPRARAPTVGEAIANYFACQMSATTS